MVALTVDAGPGDAGRDCLERGFSSGSAALPNADCCMWRITFGSFEGVDTLFAGWLTTPSEVFLLELPLLCFHFLFTITCGMILKPVLFKGIFNLACLPQDIDFAVILKEMLLFDFIWGRQLRVCGSLVSRMVVV